MADGKTSERNGREIETDRTDGRAGCGAKDNGILGKG